MKPSLPNRINDGTIFKISQRLKAAKIPFDAINFEYREHNCGKYWFAIVTANNWAVRLSQHPFEGCNPDFTIWDSKVRGTAKIAFKIF